MNVSGFPKRSAASQHSFCNMLVGGVILLLATSANAVTFDSPTHSVTGWLRDTTDVSAHTRVAFTIVLKQRNLAQLQAVARAARSGLEQPAAGPLNHPLTIAHGPSPRMSSGSLDTRKPQVRAVPEARGGCGADCP